MTKEKVLKGEIGTDMIRSVKGKPNEEIELFRQILEDERTEAEKIAAWDDGGCSTGMNED